MSDTENFLPANPWSLRPVCQDWVNRRAAELGGDVSAALSEVYEVFAQRTSYNFDHDREPLVYTPDGPNDPYILALPLVKYRGGQAPSIKPAKPHVPGDPKLKTSNLKDEFENYVFEGDDELTLDDLDVDDHGVYLNQRVRGLFDGFKLYHDKVTMADCTDFRDPYLRILGRFVVAKVTPGGAALFTKAPFRHHTKADALEEAHRLVGELNDGFAVFRCMAIIGKPKEEV